MFMENLGSDFDQTGSVLSSEALATLRKKKGECINCGQKCFKKKAVFKMVPLNIPGLVENGRCLMCSSVGRSSGASIAVPSLTLSDRSVDPPLSPSPVQSRSRRRSISPKPKKKAARPPRRGSTGTMAFPSLTLSDRSVDPPLSPSPVQSRSRRRSISPKPKKKAARPPRRGSTGTMTFPTLTSPDRSADPPLSPTHVQSRSRRRSTSPKQYKKADQQAPVKLEEAREEAHHYSQRPSYGGVTNMNCVPTTTKQELTLDLNVNVHTNRRRSSRPDTRTSNRSSLKDDSATGKERRQKRRSSISFCEQLEVQDIVPAKDLVSNTQSLWWQDTEIQQIMELSLAIVDLARLDKNTETRGLEELMRNDQAATVKTRVDVLMAQQILKQRHVQDDEALGGLYHTSTAKYLQEAALRARQDEEEARKYLADTRRVFRRMSEDQEAPLYRPATRRACRRLSNEQERHTYVAHTRRACRRMSC